MRLSDAWLFWMLMIGLVSVAVGLRLLVVPSLPLAWPDGFALVAVALAIVMFGLSTILWATLSLTQKRQGGPGA